MGQTIYRQPVSGTTQLSLPTGAEILSAEHGTTPGSVDLLVKRSTAPAVSFRYVTLTVTGTGVEVPDSYVLLVSTPPAWDSGQTLHVWELR
jgi:hypothetical protein